MALVDDRTQEIQQFYLEDARPWVIACSYGKDSTAVLQLTWLAIASLPPSRRTKPVIVLSSDTGVENPLMWAWVQSCTQEVNEAAREQSLPFRARLNQPDVKERFWTCLIGKGYSRPSPTFRWCTGRLKINPNTRYIEEISQTGEAIVFLGKRSDESTARKMSVERDLKQQVRERLFPSVENPNLFNYLPISDWTNQEVWIFLTQFPAGFRESNQPLRSLYGSFNSENECPLVVDASTAPCGARTGCFTCTVVASDRSFEAALEDDPERAWMMPLLELRDELAEPDHEKRDWRRMNGKVHFYEKKNERGETITLPIPGPYLKDWRHHWLKRVLKVQKHIQENAPTPFRDAYQIITTEELSEIRRIWRDEKNEFEDALPKLYREIMGVPFLDPTIRSDSRLDDDIYEVLLDVASETNVELEMLCALLSIEQRYFLKLNRKGIYQALETAIERKGLDKETAIAIGLSTRAVKEAVGTGDVEKIKQLLSTRNAIQQPQQLTLAAILTQESDKISVCTEEQIDDLKDAIASSDSLDVGDKEEYTSWAAIKFAKKRTGASKNVE